MARVECEVEETLIEYDQKSVDGICVTCGRCEHCVEVKGYDTLKNRQKAVEKLRATCPEGEKNHYVFAAPEREEVAMRTIDE